MAQTYRYIHIDIIDSILKNISKQIYCNKYIKTNNDNIETNMLEYIEICICKWIFFEIPILYRIFRNEIIETQLKTFKIEDEILDKTGLNDQDNTTETISCEKLNATPESTADTPTADDEHKTEMLLAQANETLSASASVSASSSAPLTTSAPKEIANTNNKLTETILAGEAIATITSTIGSAIISQISPNPPLAPPLQLQEQSQSPSSPSSTTTAAITTTTTTSTITTAINTVTNIASSILKVNKKVAIHS